MAGGCTIKRADGTTKEVAVGAVVSTNGSLRKCLGNDVWGKLTKEESENYGPWKPKKKGKFLKDIIGDFVNKNTE